jgi:hypothetical protein
VTVTLGIFSGRPDPEWTLTREQAANLATALAALPVGTGAPAVGGLGYRGFTIRQAGGTLVAYRGIVAPPGDGPRAVKVDATRSVERYLLETSRPNLSPAVYADVERALAGP